MWVRTRRPRAAIGEMHPWLSRSSLVIASGTYVKTSSIHDSEICNWKDSTREHVTYCMWWHDRLYIWVWTRNTSSQSEKSMSKVWKDQNVRLPSNASCATGNAFAREPQMHRASKVLRKSVPMCLHPHALTPTARKITVHHPGTSQVCARSPYTPPIEPSPLHLHFCIFIHTLFPLDCTENHT